MKTALTPRQIEDYRREGWLIIEDFLAAAELEEMGAAVEAGVARMGRRKLAGAGSREIVDGKNPYYDRVFLQRVNLWRVNDTIKRYFLSPGLGEMLCALAGIDGIRVWHDQTLQKQPWGHPTSWHLDVPRWSFHSPDAISIWIALDDSTVQNGCMYYLPGSHKMAGYDRKGDFGPNMGALFDEYPEFSTIEPVAAVMKAGSAGFHNGLMAHAAGPNMTPRPRRAMTCAYMPDGATFNGIQNILSDEHMARLEVGDVLDDPDQTPLAWSRKEAVR